MTLLHILSKNQPNPEALQHGINTMGDGHELLILANGVYTLLPHSLTWHLLTKATQRHALYAIKDDLIARGLKLEALGSSIQLIDYSTFVDLVAKHQSTYRWS